MYTLTRTLTTHVYSTNPRSISYILSYFTITRVSDYSVYESRDLADNLWNVALSRHFCIILLQLPKSGSKARWQNFPSYNICLIGRNKKKERGKLSLTSLAMLQFIDIWWLPLFVKDHLSPLIFRPDRFDWNLPFHVHCRTSLHSVCREFGKGINNDKSPIPLG